MTLAGAEAALDAAEAEYKRAQGVLAAAERARDAAREAERAAYYAMSDARARLARARIEAEEAPLPRFRANGYTYLLLGWTARGAPRAREPLGRVTVGWGDPKPNPEVTISVSRRSLAKNPELAALVRARAARGAGGGT